MQDFPKGPSFPKVGNNPIPKQLIQYLFTVGRCQSLQSLCRKYHRQLWVRGPSHYMEKTIWTNRRQNVRVNIPFALLPIFLGSNPLKEMQLWLWTCPQVDAPSRRDETLNIWRDESDSCHHKNIPVSSNIHDTLDCVDCLLHVYIELSSNDHPMFQWWS